MIGPSIRYNPVVAWSERLSKAENKLLCRAVAEACELVGRGDPVAGYRCLATGLERVSEFASEGEAWAGELVDSYQSALKEFASVRRSAIGRQIPTD